MGLGTVSHPTSDNMYKLLVLAGLVAVARAGAVGLGYAAAPVAYAAHAAPLAYAAHAAPVAYAAHAAPAAITTQQSNILRSYGNLGQVSTYSKTIDTPYSSVSKSDVRVSNPGLATVAHAAPVAYAAHAAPVAYAAHAAPVAYAAHGYAAPLAARAIAAPAVAHGGLLGVAYSAAPAVAHVSYDAPLAHYAW